MIKKLFKFLKKLFTFDQKPDPIFIPVPKEHQLTLVEDKDPICEGFNDSIITEIEQSIPIVKKRKRGRPRKKQIRVKE